MVAVDRRDNRVTGSVTGLRLNVMPEWWRRASGHVRRLANERSRKEPVLPNIANDLPPEDLKVLLEEAEEQLQLLDEEVIRLEKEATEEGLAAIFRAAHTLKGSSA